MVMADRVAVTVRSAEADTPRGFSVIANVCRAQASQLPAVVCRTTDFAGRYVDAERRAALAGVSTDRLAALSRHRQFRSRHTVAHALALGRRDCRSHAETQSASDHADGADAQRIHACRRLFSRLDSAVARCDSRSGQRHGASVRRADAPSHRRRHGRARRPDERHRAQLRDVQFGAHLGSSIRRDRAGIGGSRLVFFSEWRQFSCRDCRIADDAISAVRS